MTSTDGSATYPKASGVCARCGRLDAPVANGSDELLPHIRRVPEGKAYHAYLCKGRAQRPESLSQSVIPSQISGSVVSVGALPVSEPPAFWPHEVRP